MNNIIQYTIGLTCVGGHYLYDLIRALRGAEDFTVRLVGIDANPNARGQWFVDAFEIAPLAEKGEDVYMARLLEICRIHNIDALIVGSEAETRVVAKNKARFAAQGVRVAVNDNDLVEVLTDKLKALEFLHRHGIEVGRYLPVNSFNDARDAVRELGYPYTQVVLKPRCGAGSRGILIADESKPMFEFLLPQRFCGTGTIEAILNECEKRGESLENCIATPHYGNNVYDVDCLAKRGDPVAIVPRLRQYENPLSPINEGCKIDLKPSIVQYAREICQAFRVHGAADFDIALDSAGIPRLLDTSSRMSGSVGASYTAGINIPVQLVRILFDLPLRHYDIREGLELRPVPHMVAL